MSKSRLGGLFALLLSLVGCGNKGPDQQEAYFIANLITSMQISLNIYKESRGKPDAQRTEDDHDLLRITIRRVSSERAGLEMSLARLTPGKSYTNELAQFLAKWQPDTLETAVYAHPDRKGGIDAALSRLAKTFPEESRPLFRIFRYRP
jgi:hypothetical protein